MSNNFSSEFNPTIDQLDMTSEEKDILWKLRNKKLFFLLGAYLPLSYVLIEAWVNVYPGNFFEAIKELFRFRIYPTWFLLFLFIILTIYFINYFLKSVNPLLKDLKEGKKSVIFFVPGKYQTPFFAEYYLKTFLKDTSLIRIDKDMYDSIQSDSRASIHISPNSKYVFQLEVDGKTLKFEKPIIISEDL